MVDNTIEHPYKDGHPVVREHLCLEGVPRQTNKKKQASAPDQSEMGHTEFTHWEITLNHKDTEGEKSADNKHRD